MDEEARRVYIGSQSPRLFPSMLGTQFAAMNMLLRTMLFIIVAMVCYHLTPAVQGILHQKEQLLSAQVDSISSVPDLEAKLSALEARSAELTEAGIDARLSKIEDLVESGSLKANEVKDFVELQSEMAVLKTYLFSDAAKMLEFKQLQQDYARLSTDQDELVTKERLALEVSSLGRMQNFLLAVVGILFTIQFGTWVIGRIQRTPTRPKKTAKKRAAREGGSDEEHDSDEVAP